MKKTNIIRKFAFGAAIGATAVFLTLSQTFASSHREAPLITGSPKLDGCDFYMFNSYETGRSNFVTMVADYLPLQDPYGGPNYFQLETNGIYEIHIDNNGDAQEKMLPSPMAGSLDQLKNGFKVNFKILFYYVFIIITSFQSSENIKWT